MEPRGPMPHSQGLAKRKWQNYDGKPKSIDEFEEITSRELVDCNQIP